MSLGGTVPLYQYHCFQPAKGLEQMKIFLLKLFLFPGLRRVRSPSRVFTLCTVFGRMPGFEPELLRPQPGFLPMSYTHP